MTPRSPATFFQSPRLLEERKPFSNALYSQPARATAFSGLGSVTNGLAGLGDWFTDALKTMHVGVMDVVDTVSGRKTAVEQQKAAEALAAQQQASILEQAKLRAMGWAKTAPWLAIGGTVLGLGVLYVALKKRGG